MDCSLLESLNDALGCIERTLSNWPAWIEASGLEQHVSRTLGSESGRLCGVKYDMIMVLDFVEVFSTDISWSFTIPIQIS